MQGQAPLHGARALRDEGCTKYSPAGVFAHVPGCAGKPLPTHLCVNEPSHTPRIFCPQIPNSEHTELSLAVVDTRCERGTAFACRYLFVDFILVGKGLRLDMSSDAMVSPVRWLSQVLNLGTFTWNTVGGEGSHPCTKEGPPLSHRL